MRNGSVFSYLSSSNSSFGVFNFSAGSAGGIISCSSRLECCLLMPSLGKAVAEEMEAVSLGRSKNETGFDSHGKNS